MFQHSSRLRVSCAGCVAAALLLSAATAPFAAGPQAVSAMVEDARFGSDIDVSGNCAVIGAPGDGAEAQGAVYTFRRDPTSGLWMMVQVIEPPTPAPAGTQRSFGAVLDRSGSTLAIASRSTGDVHLYSSTGVFCTFAYKETLAHPEERVGALALSGPGTLAVGATDADFRGRVQTWEREGSDWEAGDSLTAGGDSQFDGFASRLSFVGTSLVVAAPFSGDSGAVYQFVRLSAGRYFRAQRLPSPDSNRIFFGWDIAQIDGTLVVGAPATRGDGIEERVYVFERDGNGQWAPAATLDPEPGEVFFGGDLALAGTTSNERLLLVGTERRRVYRYRKRPGEPWAFVEMIHAPQEVAPGFASPIRIAGTTPQRVLFGNPADAIGDVLQAGTVAAHTLSDGGPAVLNQLISSDRPPVISVPGAEFLTAEDSNITINVDLADADTEGTELVLQAFSSSPALISDAALADGLTARDDSGLRYRLRLQPAPNANGIATVALLAGDLVNVSSAAFTLRVAPVNDRPAVRLSTTNIEHDRSSSGEQALAGFVAALDPGPEDESDQQPLRYLVEQTGGSDAVVNELVVDPDGTLSYVLTGDSGTAIFELVVQDDGGTERGGRDLSFPQAFSISVGDQATPPTGEGIFRDGLEGPLP